MVSCSARFGRVLAFFCTVLRSRPAVSATLLLVIGLGQITRGKAPDSPQATPLIHAARGQYDCAYQSPEKSSAAIREAVARGEIADPTIDLLPPRGGVAGAPVGGNCVPIVTRDDIFPYEDSAGVLLTNFSDGQLFSLMSNAANALILSEGDDFDFIAFWVNFTPDHQLGAAFYLGLFNDITGLGQSTYNNRGVFGLASNKVQGYVMMWNINSSSWQTGTGSNANFTRLVLGQEFEHRFGMFLPPINGGRQLQGDNGNCGRGAHWSFRVDGQGSGMEIAEWVGTGTVTRSGGSIRFNTDIGGVFSYSDLYLMGYVSPAEMDAGNSELRYLDNNLNCGSPYSGAISSFSSANIIGSAGARTPNSIASQKDYRTAWIMIHQPAAPPSTGQLNKTVGILNTWTDTWHDGTLGRGTMNNTFRTSCTPLLELRPQGATTANDIVGRTIVLDSGASEVTLDLFVSGWTPNDLSAYSVVLDSTSYTSGTSGTLSPVGGCCPGTASGASIDTGRADYLFAGTTSASDSTDLTSLSFRWDASLGDLGESVVDPSERRYIGTLVVDVPSNATGEFTIRLDEQSTQLEDAAGIPIPELLYSPATISIRAGNVTCDLAVTLDCNTTTEIDNTFVSGGPSPNYSCRFGNAQNGTLWYKFVATSAAARVSTCNSIAQDSTLGIYSGDCAAPNEIGCAEDECGPSTYLSDVCVSALTPGETYYVQISAWDSAARGKYTLELDCPCEGISDCNNNGVDDFQDIQNQTSEDCNGSFVPDECELVGNDQNGNLIPDECEPVMSLDQLPTTIDKNRFISVIVPPATGQATAIRVRLTSLHHPALPVDAPDFTAFEGQDRWVVPINRDPGTNEPIIECVDSPSFGTTYFCARLSCTPEFVDWATLLGGEPLHITGEAIVPSSVYDVVQLPAFCSGDVPGCGAVSSSIQLTTSTWGDADPGLLNVFDITQVVDRVKDVLGATSELRTLFHPNYASPDTRAPDVTDITLAVDALKLIPYPLEGPLVCP